MDVHPSAYKHGVSDADIQHALAHSLVTDQVGEDPDRYLVLGPTVAANFLELVVMVTSTGEQLVIHAMPMRSQYQRLLGG